MTVYLMVFQGGSDRIQSCETQLTEDMCGLTSLYTAAMCLMEEVSLAQLISIAVSQLLISTQYLLMRCVYYSVWFRLSRNTHHQYIQLCKCKLIDLHARHSHSDVIPSHFRSAS